MSGTGPALRVEAKDAVIFAGSNLLNRVGSLLLLPLYWTKLSPVDYGVLASIAVLGVFQNVLGSVSLDLAITRFYYEWPEASRRRNLGAIWVWSWLAVLVVGLGFALLIPVVGPIAFPDVDPNPWLFLGIAANAIGTLFIIPASAIRIKRLPWLFATYNLIGFATATGLGLWLVLVEDLGLFGYVLSMIGSNLALAIIGAVVMLRFARPAFSSPGLGEAVQFALPALPSQLIGAVGLSVDRLLLGSLTNLQTLGIYAVAQRFGGVIDSLHSSIKMTFGPMMMKNITVDGDRGKAIVVAVTPYYLIPYFAAAVGLTSFIGPLVRFIGRADYVGVVNVVPWLVGVQVVSCLYFYYCNGLFLGKRTDLLTGPALVQLLVLVVSSLLLIVPLQMAGVIVSRYAAAVVFFGLSLYLSQRTFRIDHRWGALVRLAIAATGFAVVGNVLVLDSLALEILVKSAMWLAFVGLAVVAVGGGSAWSSIAAVLARRPARSPADRDETLDVTESVEGGPDRRPTFD